MTENGAPSANVAKPAAQLPFMVVAVVFLLVALVFALPTFLIIAAGMVPTFLASLVPAAPGQKRSMLAVAMLNFAGILPVLGMLWDRGHNIGNSLQLLSEPVPWMIMLGAAAVAAMLQNILPGAAISVAERAAEQKVEKLLAQQKSLIAEWGEDVKGRAKPEAADPGAGSQ